jgi:hypothetical protein
VKHPHVKAKAQQRLQRAADAPVQRVLDVYSAVRVLARKPKSPLRLRRRCTGPMRDHGRVRPRSKGENALVNVEPMTGIEPAYSAWEADVLPLNYIGRFDHEG